MAQSVTYSDDVSCLKGVGPKVLERLSKLGLLTIQDVLFHLPFRYEDRTRVVPVGRLRHGQSCLIEVEIDHAEIAFTRKGKRRRMLLLKVSDGTGGLVLRFFYFNKQQQAMLVPGARIRCFGDVRFGTSSLEIVHPEYTLLSENKATSIEPSLTPVYHTTDGVSQLLLRRITEQCLVFLQQSVLLEPCIPDQLFKESHYSSIADALSYVHRPPLDADLTLMDEYRHAAQLRLITEELVAQHLSLQSLRKKTRQHKATDLKSDNHLIYQFQTSLPFELTNAQLKVCQAIMKDLESGVPMLRLVQGDVGSGKTVVAASACLKAVEAGKQAAIMAPTEILAEQHYDNFSRWFEPLGVKVGWLSGQVKGKKRLAVLKALADGELQVMIGTHALFQSDVVFKNLALAITDEQHRFGVQQRMALAYKANEDDSSTQQLAHQLIMTATPIPRSLAMTAYADLDYSVIDELPPGRKEVSTVVIPEQRREEILQRIYKSCHAGKQAYWVCTLVEESESLQCQAAEDTAQQLSEALPDLNIGLIHGRMKADEKDRLMQSFKKGDIQLLVATTVIEVGVDVANASLMIIENAERLRSVTAASAARSSG